MHGRLVSKNGAAMARAMMAGFISGVAEGVTPTKIKSINENPSGTALFEQTQYSDVLSAGAFKGASNAMNSIAEYYTEMAENMYPVIELSPGLNVDFIVQKGMSIEWK